MSVKSCAHDLLGGDASRSTPAAFPLDSVAMHQVTDLPMMPSLSSPPSRTAPVSNRTICSQTLTKEHAAVFRDAVEGQYWYELFLDDLPMWGFVGELKKGKGGEDEAYVFTHKVIDISYNKDRVSTRGCGWVVAPLLLGGCSFDWGQR